VGLRDAVVRFPAGDPEDDLHDHAVERLNRSLRKVIKTRGSFPTDDAALELLYLAIRNAGLRWRRPIEWTAAMSQFAILFGDHFVLSPR
jgi:putative transposase